MRKLVVLVVTWCCLCGDAYDVANDVCSNAVFYLNPNNTICRNKLVDDHFEKFGFPDVNIPKDLFNFLPHLLHEGSVAHHVDVNKAFVRVGSGHEGVVYKAELRDTGAAVIVKTLRSKTFLQIYHEARILTYLSDVAAVPRVIGLLPTGPSLDNMSIVSEYVKNCSTLGVTFNNTRRISKCQSLNISYQMASALELINERYVLHNDLHHKNILIQWRGPDPVVYFIDFGDATFRHGRAVKSPQNNNPHRIYLPPEVSYEQSIPPSDVYGLGQNIKTIGKLSHIDELVELANRCMRTDPSLRTSVKTLKNEIILLLQRACAVPRSVQNNFETDVPPQCRNQNGAFHHLTLPILLRGNFDLKRSFIGKSGRHLVKYKPSGKTLILHIFPKSNFRYIRHWARVNLYLNDTGYVPSFMGLVFYGPTLSDVALVEIPTRERLTFSYVLKNSGTLNHLQSANLLREISKCLDEFNQRNLGCRRLYTKNILISFVHNTPSIKFIHLGRIHYGVDPSKTYQSRYVSGNRVNKRRVHCYNQILFPDVVRHLLPYVEDFADFEKSVNTSSVKYFGTRAINNWMFILQ